MKLSDQMRARIAGLVTQRSTLHDEQAAVLTAVEARADKKITDDEQKTYDEKRDAKKALDTEIAECETRLAEIEDEEKRDAAAVESRAKYGVPEPSAKVTDPEVYAKGNNQRSYFRDLAKSQLFGDRDASERLSRHAKAAADKEARALGNTNTTGGSGGEFAPPDWLVDDFVALARPGRATGGLYAHMDVPRGVSSLNLPKILTGTTAALQSTQNTALSQTDLTTGSVGTGFSTIGGKQVAAQQLLDQSEIPFDQVITADLAAAWGLSWGTNIVSGAGTGANNNSVINGLANAAVPSGNQMTFTSGSPTAALFYSKAAGMLSAFATNRYAEPTVWLMHPRRWYWLLAQSDSQGRPLVVPDATLADAGIRSMNPLASNTGSPVQVVGAVGLLLGLPVVIDPLLPINLGGGTNQDEVFLLKADDLWVAESAPVAEVFNQPYADSMGVLFRIYNYTGTILNRQLASIATMNGTGLTTPAF